MTVKNWIVSNYEKILYITPDGVRYNIHDPARRAIITMDGWGMPPMEVAESRGPFQHGTTALTARLGARKVTVNIAYTGCNRDDYWDERFGLLDALRISRTDVNNPSMGHLRWYRSDGTVRQLDVIATEGPAFASSKGWNSFGYSDQIVFTAYDPTVYNPTIASDLLGGWTCTPESRHIFPFSFDSGHIVFGGSYCYTQQDFVITYPGTWETFPVIVLEGAMTDPVILHNETGQKIEFVGYTLLAGDAVTIDLSYNSKTVVLYPDTSLLAYISDDSNLGTFSILPSPLVAGGINTISVTAPLADANARVSLEWYIRYKGI